ncbi:jhy protein homolog isoform X1 [Lates calcarifer]|uniref:Jhy protein homolog isoform X1 n=1 Tax=Lates calcarifer TaxID=8187 RepID=A0AAJ7Q6J7_LATCA|nr:jhy protein homolog isoform X1 [Lates calcarifer]XP_050934713.1 jhy protein homolog isoform X1 [Lates calcarifer]
MDMDKGLRHGKMSPVLKTKQKRHPSPRQAVLANQWESVESDTESLAQERAYQQQLIGQHIGQHQDKYILLQKKSENTDSLQQGEEESEDANDDQTEDLQLYDSLEVASNTHTNRNLKTEYLDTQIDERGGSQLLSDDDYSDLRYDPNWRTNLKGNGCFDDSPQISVEEYCQGYKHIIDTSPAIMVTPHIDGSESDQPYRLHPQDGQTSSVTSTHCHNHALQCGSPEGDLSRSSKISTKNESDNNLQRGSRQKHEQSCVSAGENISRSSEPTEEINTTEFDIYQQEQRCTQGGSIQKMSTSTLMNPKVLWNKKLERVMEDIVERNKMTLGCNTSKCGSYVRAHALKQEMPHNANKVHETLKEIVSTENKEDSSDPELRWLQRAQQLQVTQIKKGKKAQQKEYPNPFQQQQPPALMVNAERGDCLSSPLARQAAITQPKPQKMTSSQPLPPTIQLNISLNTPSHLLSLLQQKGQDAIINIVSPHGHPHWSPAYEVQLASSPGYQQTNPGKFSHVSQERLNTQLHQQHLESWPEQWQRTTALKWPLSCEGEDQTWSSDEVYTKCFPQNLTRTPTTASSQSLGSYTVLPPIGKPLTEKEPKLSPGHSVNATHHIHRSNSDSYVVQMEKKKQLRVTYKAYKQLKTDVNQKGPHLDYTAIEKTKIKQQKLYSNVIREQNKKISRIPFLPAKDPEGSDKKVPRMKALEYAKTIAKPPVQSQPKQREKNQPEGLTELSPYLQGLDVSQLTTLGLLRKRHEEEKQAVALFRKIHAV